jgi:endonuclease/exonuclease/phosphatase family metal-dependent hydrolase
VQIPDRVTARATFISLCSHQEIPGPVKSETDGKLDACESCRADKNTWCACRRKLDDSLITGVRGKEIACGVKGEAETILSKYHAQAAWSELWKSMNGVDPPRGFAFAWFKIGNEDVGVYSLHLKSNLITHSDKEAETAKNIQKRQIAIAQLLTHIHDVIGTKMPTIKGVVIGGDFNTNHDQAMFAAETTLDSLADAGYQNGFEALPLSERVTHAGSHGFPDATFDFIFAKGLTALQSMITRTNASDHWPVTGTFALH